MSQSATQRLPVTKAPLGINKTTCRSGMLPRPAGEMYQPEGQEPHPP